MSISPAVRLRVYGVAAVVMLAGDLLWLGVVSPPLYQATVGPLLRPQPDVLAAVLFYAIYVMGLCEFVVLAQPPGTARGRVAARGALFGFVAYATFDLTALAMIQGWSALITAIDMAWGTLLTASVATATHALTRRHR